MIFQWMNKTSRAIQAELQNGGRYGRLSHRLSELGLHIIQFQNSVEGIGSVYGLGVSQNLKSAQITAYFEFLERKTFLIRDREFCLGSSNGIAAHKFRLLAKRSARNELFERDAFLAHWYLRQPFIPLRTPTSGISQQIITHLLQRGFETLMFRTTLGYASTAVCFIVDSSTGGFCIGTSSGKGQSGDSFKALIEAVINLDFGDYGVDRTTLIAEAREKKFETLSCHRSYWLYINGLPDWVRISGLPTSLPLQNIAINYFYLTQKPFPVVAARSPDLLALRAGFPDPDTMSLLTRRHYAGYKAQDVLPHPLF